jgi:hypothetical protein
MRRFIRERQGLATDPEFGFRFYSIGKTEWDDSAGIYTDIFKLVRDNDHSTNTIQILRPMESKRKRVDGVIFVENIIGFPDGTPVKDIIKLKDFCSFLESDFNFLCYVGSAITHSELVISVRSIAVVSESNLASANITASNDIPRTEAGMIILDDSRNELLVADPSNIQRHRRQDAERRIANRVAEDRELGIKR